ncbi:MAG: DivIVA domain-containing protein [Pseudonocardia sp.]|nr:DivIVA domain-containing protein [Pseudonocardia sp.]
MGTALIYLLVVAAVAAVVFVLAAMVFGRGEELAPLVPGATPTRLPADSVRGADVRGLRFQQVVRGYKMGEVDWVLQRLADELDEVTDERDGLAARVAELESGSAVPAARRPAGGVHRRTDQAEQDGPRA